MKKIAFLLALTLFMSCLLFGCTGKTRGARQHWGIGGRHRRTRPSHVTLTF